MPPDDARADDAPPAGVAVALAKVTAALPGGGEERPGQTAMAEAVARSITARRHLVVQAGTGTGKSLAYLVPAVTAGQPVVVATATKALQDQLATKDVPAVAGALGRPVRAAVLKGRANYLCLQRANEVGGRGVQQDLGAAASIGDEHDGAGPPGAAGPGRLADQVLRLLDWARSTRTGDRGDLDFEPHDRAWGMVSVGPRECPGARRCPEGARCFAEQARERAAEAEVVIVNTHLYGAHLASGGAVLPPHEVVVFDEAHAVEETMTSSLGVDVAPGRLIAVQGMVRALAEEDDAQATDLGGVAARLRDLLSSRAGERVLGDPPAPGDGDLTAALELAETRVETVQALLTSGGHKGDDEPDRAARRVRAITAAGHLLDDLRRFAGRGLDEVAWVDGTPRSPVLRLSPIDVGPPLAELLWGSVTAVLTSATVPLSLPAKLGMPEPQVDVLDVGSPFDYRHHALFYVAKHLPDPRRPGARAAIEDELGSLIGAAGGRTLALFTSRNATDTAASSLAGRLPYRMLVQGDLPKSRLLEQFARDETSCLFATLGFWQGVDVPGRALSLVTLDRLPFGRPGDPLLDARRERAGAAAFTVVDLPRAATLLAQGVGRLIRSSTDRGVVAVLDPRLATAGYRRVLLAGLPPMRRTVDHDEVVKFLRQVVTAER